MCLSSTLFLIEDDAAVENALHISMALAGLKIEVYPSGQAFLAAYTKDQRGCLLINLSQPEMEALTVQQELIRRNCQIPIIFMTEIGTIRRSLPAMQSGAFCLLEKPFPRQLLLDSIRAAMEQDCKNRSAPKSQAETDEIRSPLNFISCLNLNNINVQLCQ
ncbi:MAG: response regulator [Methylovulum sp.]|nr:response regulator [Methylovulum sp.]